jgi:PAS domain S-box-containing protein
MIAPAAAHLLWLAPLGLPEPGDYVPYAFNISSIVMIYGMFRHRLLNIMPFTYQEIIDSINDGIIVISNQDIVLHLNNQAETILGASAVEIIGLPVQEALATRPELLKACFKNEPVSEILLPEAGQPCYYELHIAGLSNKIPAASGRLLVLHNINQRALAQRTLQHNQEMLKRSEEKYRSLVENINEMIFVFNMDGTLAYLSPVSFQITGNLPEKSIGRHLSELFSPETLAINGTSIQRALAGEPQTFEIQMEGRNGYIHHMHVATQPILQNGILVGIQGIATDITERMQVEEALERRASQLTLINFIGEQIASFIEPNSLIDSATHLIQKHFGYYHVAIFTPDQQHRELVLRSTSGAFSELFPENHHLRYGQGMVGWAAENKNVLLANDVRLEPRYTNFSPNKIFTQSELAVPILVGEEVTGILDIQSPLKDAFDDNDVRVMKTVADQIAVAMENARLYEEVRLQLIERGQRESMLRVQRDLLVHLSAAKTLKETLQIAVKTLSEAFSTSQAMIALLNREGDSMRLAALETYPESAPQQAVLLDRGITGWVARSAQPALIADLGKDSHVFGVATNSLSLLCIPLLLNDRVIGIIQLESDSPSTFSQDDQQLLTSLSNSLVVLIERSRLFEEVERARTELEDRAQELEKANASLREMDRLKSQFLANMSHELRTPLNSIIGFSELLSDGLIGPLNDEQDEFIRDIYDSGQHLLALINNLLDFSKIEAGRMTLEPSSFAVRALFDELRLTIMPLVEKKSQAIIFHQDEDITLVTADPMRIKQVFLNLLGNANKFTPPGGRISVNCCKGDADHLLFTVSDTGIGIRGEDQEMIFEEFRQVDGTMTREVSGTGLGLAISRRIVEMHDGQIWVESAPGQGATFFVRLPRQCNGNNAAREAVNV